MNLFALTSAFVPTPTFGPHRIISEQVFDFVRKLQWRLSLSFPHDTPRFGILRSGRWAPDRLVRPGVKRLTQRILNGVRMLLRKEHTCHFPSNVDVHPGHLLQSLDAMGCRAATADKGGRWAIVSSDSYHSEAVRQLQHNAFYAPVTDNSISRSASLRIAALLKYLKERKFISSKEFRYLQPPTQPTARRFKLLPKLHKDTWLDPAMPPGRPIVADTGSASRRAGDLIEHFLRPLCVQLPSHLKDTRHLIAILRETILPPNCLLFTLDVEALYTNVPIDEGIQAVSTMFLRFPDVKRPSLSILTLLRVILNSNVFVYEDTTWLQKHGVSMGQKFGGSFANVFLGHWERAALSSAPRQPLVWLRFQDDIFGVWQHDTGAFQDFVTHLNSRHSKIKLTPTSGSSVHFLDVHIAINGTSLVHEPYFKPSDSHLVLPPSSHHPPTTFRSLLFGELLRLATNSSSRDGFTRARAQATPVWRRQGYTNAAIRAALKRVLTVTNQFTEWGPGMRPCSHNCSACKYVISASTFRDSSSNLIYPITSRLSCTSSGVLYLIHCKACGKQYVGETKRTLGTRILEHLSAIRSRTSNARLHRHFSHSCSLQDFSFLGFAIHPRGDTRKAKECEWIRKLHTIHPLGLNTTSQEQPQRTTLVLPYCACSTRVASAIHSWCPPDLCRISFSRTRNLKELASQRTTQQRHSDA